MMYSGHFSGLFCGPGGFFSGIPLGGIFHVLLWGLVLFLLYRIARGMIGSTNKPTDHPESLAILEKHYASGQIDQEEFFKRKKDLGF